MAYAITNYSFPGVAGAKPRITAALDSAADVEAATITTAVLNRLATAVEVMATKQDTMGESVERLETKVDTLESKPGKRWDGLVDKLILTVAAALIGFLLAQLGVA